MTTSNQANPQNPNDNSAGFPPAPSTASKEQRFNRSGGSYFAHPYSTCVCGFYFDDYREYEAQAAALRDPFNQPVEEFEIQAIDLDGESTELFNALSINQATLERWFDEVVDLDTRDKAGVFFLVTNNGYDFDAAMDKKDDITLYRGSLVEAATELFDDCYASEIPAELKMYIDYEAFARDCSAGGNMVEFEFDGETWTCTSANNT